MPAFLRRIGELTALPAVAGLLAGGVGLVVMAAAMAGASWSGGRAMTVVFLAALAPGVAWALYLRVRRPTGCAGRDLRPGHGRERAPGQRAMSPDVDRGITGRQPKAVQSALAILETVARAGAGVTAKEVAEELRLPPATTYRLLNLLVGEETSSGCPTCTASRSAGRWPA